MNSLRETCEKIQFAVLGVHVIKNGSLVGSGTGFILEDYFVTNYHIVAAAVLDVISEKNNFEVIITNIDAVREKTQNGYEYKQPFCRISGKILHASRVNYSEENNHDFAIFDASIVSVPKNKLSRGGVEKFGVGDEVAFLGYPFGTTNIILHRGMISSIYDSGVAKVFQLDASTNCGNSGGPVFDIRTGEVIGIITRKQDGLRENFKKLKEALKGNADILSKRVGVARLGGVDPMEAMAMQQSQLLSLCEEIERSANVGIGYAHTITPILDEIDRLNKK